MGIEASMRIWDYFAHRSVAQVGGSTLPSVLTAEAIVNVVAIAELYSHILILSS
jgi:hypothetical protein